jgi:hypothetical protein
MSWHKTMLTYYYALISDPCERTVDALLDYARAHPGCLLTLPPADSRAMYRAIATAWGNVLESEEFVLGPRPAHPQLEPRTLRQASFPPA